MLKDTVALETKIRSSDDDRESMVDAVASVPLRLPSAEIAVSNAVRLRAFRQRLVDHGAFTVDDLAAGRSTKRGTAQKWLDRRVKDGKLFTATVNGRIVVPACLLDPAFDPDPIWEPVLAILTEASETSWGIWAWMESPQSVLSGDIPSEAIRSEPERVIAAAMRHVRLVSA